MDQSKVNKNFKATVKSNFKSLSHSMRKIREGIKKISVGMQKNRKDLQLLNSAFKDGLEQQQQYINNLKNSIRNDNRQRDQNIREISDNLALLKSFVIKKLSNHPNDYMEFHQSSQGNNNSSVGPPIQGGRRKTRKRKRKRKNKGKKRKTKKR